LLNSLRYSPLVDLRLPCLQYAAFALWNLGYPDQALKRGQGALTLARELSHPFSLLFALATVAILSHSPYATGAKKV
jgi:hypothetical protein